MSKSKKLSNSDISGNEKNTYNSKAAFYALPKPFIIRFLNLLTPNTLKVFIALTYFTDHLNIIKFPNLITYKKLLKMTGIKKVDTIRKAFKELEDLNLIGGFSPGHGSENTKFYFTFDIIHYRTEECPFEIEELESYYSQFEYKEKESLNKNEIVEDSVTEEFFENTVPNKEYTPLPKNVPSFNTINTTTKNSNSNDTKNLELNKELIVLANNSIEFKKQFNDFCIKDSSRYREKTFYWIIYHATKLNLSFADLLESIEIANSKGKQGKMCYLIGIMRNKSASLSKGILAQGKNIVYQVFDYVKQRMGVNLEYFKNISLCDNNIVFEVDSVERDVVKDYCFLITSDINKRFNTQFSYHVA